MKIVIVDDLFIFITSFTALSSFQLLLDNYMTWTLEGENNSAVQTKRFNKSVTGPLLVFGVEDTHDMLVLDKVVPGPLHLYLSCNEVINHCEKTCCPEVKDVMLDRVDAQVHVYQGKIENYEGPSLQKIFSKLI